MPTATTLYQHRKRTKFWLSLAVAILVIGAMGFGVIRIVDKEVRSLVHSSLDATLATQVQVLEHWYDELKATAKGAVEQPGTALMATDAAAGLDEGWAELLIQRFDTAMAPHGFVLVSFVTPNGKLVQASDGSTKGRIPDKITAYLPADASAGVTVTPPLVVPERVTSGDPIPRIVICAPIAGSDTKLIGYLLGYLDPSAKFSDFFELARIGESGETYAINGHGLLVSRSRFMETLTASGLLPSDAHDGILQLSMRDPKQRIDSNNFKASSLADAPFTVAARELIAGDSGFQLDPYNDYRGVRVIGSWQWMPELGIGLVAEIDAFEAYGPLNVLRIVFGGLMAIVAIGVILIIIIMQIQAGLRRRFQKAAAQARELGQYQLDRLLGAGGMGEVYLAHHALMRRPTAVKLLQETNDEETILRFEREVRLSC